MKTIAWIFLTIGPVFIWIAFYSLIEKALSNNKKDNPLPEIFFLSLYTFLLVNCVLNDWFE